MIIEFKRNIYNHEELETYLYKYRYDEAGNRILKITYKLNGESWDLLKKEYYSRDLSGKEVAVYEKLPNSDMTLKFWNVFGLSNEGQIFPDGKIYYYLKDHLGSIRAVYDNYLNLVSAQDLDPWGYELTGRAYIDTLKYKFTSKERDKESTYDYFGARYYDSRIGNWLSPDPLFEKYLQWSPYNYVLRDPNILIDVNGKDAIIEIDNEKNTINIKFKFIYIYNKLIKYKEGLNDAQFDWLNKFKTDIESNWSKKFEYNGKEYTMTASVELIQVNNPGEAGINNDLYKGTTFIQNDWQDILFTMADANYGVGVRDKTMYMSSNNLNPFEDTGSHEAGHLMGLPGEDFGSGIMHHKKSRDEFRFPPSERDLQNVININNINLQTSSIGILKTYQK